MTEAEWLEGRSPTLLLDQCRGRIRQHARKLRLFAAACCRRVERYFDDPAFLAALDAAERLADGQLTEEAKCPIWNAVVDACGQQEVANSWQSAVLYSLDDRPFSAATGSAVRASATMSGKDLGEYQGPEELAQADLVRDVFGLHLIRPVAFDAGWRTSTVVSIARTMYNSRDFSPMPLLADALQDAGCENEDILNHCRSGGPHVRGCWVVDLILGKE